MRKKCINRCAAAVGRHASTQGHHCGVRGALPPPRPDPCAQGGDAGKDVQCIYLYLYRYYLCIYVYPKPPPPPPPSLFRAPLCLRHPSSPLSLPAQRPLYSRRACVWPLSKCKAPLQSPLPPSVLHLIWPTVAHVAGHRCRGQLEVDLQDQWQVLESEVPRLRVPQTAEIVFVFKSQWML